MNWQDVDAGWGRRAIEAAYLFENMHWREYLHLFDQTDVSRGTRYLDIACGSGLAVQLACERGATATGLDASKRLGAIAAARAPQADIRIGDMFNLPFDDNSFDVATSFRGIWGNCLDALREARRVVRPGGNVGLSFWGHQKKMQAYPLFAVLGRTSQEERQNTGSLVSVGLPGVAEQLMVDAGLAPGSRTSLRLHWEFPDAEFAARALASVGPAYLAIQHLGEEAFMASVREAAADLCVEGAGVRAEVEIQFLVGEVH
ncbi:MAG: class I SAM-dependent methyltransferase [Candidatus Tectomicrobia bacterium]